MHTNVLFLVLSLLAVHCARAVNGNRRLVTDRSTTSEYELDGQVWPMFRNSISRAGFSPTALAPTTCGLSWTVETGNEVHGSPVLDEALTAYVGSYDQHLYVIEVDGTIAAKVQLDGQVEGSAALTPYGVTIATMNGTLYSFDFGSFDASWSQALGEPIACGIGYSEVFDGSVILPLVIIGTLSGNVYAFNAESGKQVWQFEVPAATTSTQGSQVFSSPSVDSVSGDVFFGTHDGRLYCLDAVSGTQRWTADMGDGQGFFSSPALFDNNSKFVIGSTSGSVYCIDADSGMLIWETPPSQTMYVSPSVGDGLVYGGNDGGDIFALDVESGEVVWTYTTGDSVRSSPAVTGGWEFDGLVLTVGSYDASLYALNATDGTLLWSYETLGQVGASPGVAGPEYVVVGSHDFNVYGFSGDKGAAC